MAEVRVELLTPEEEEQILEEALRRFGESFPFKSLEELLMSEDGLGLKTATPLQRAICRIAQGVPLDDLAEDPVVQNALGHGTYEATGAPPDELVILAAVRTAKSMIAAAVAIWASQTINVDMLTGGEIARYSIVSLELDNARVVHSHILGALLKPALLPLRIPDKDASKWREVIDDTGVDVVGTEFLWHPSGRPVEIRVVAGKRAGGSVVSRWSAGMCLDEAPRMLGSGDHVVNYDDMKNAVVARLLPGASILSIGSPWVATGPIYEMQLNNWGMPTSELVVVKANGPAMNPYRWTPEYCEKIRKRNPLVYKTDVLAEFIDTEDQLIPNAVIKQCMSKSTESHEYNPRAEYVAAIDPATRKNAWTFVIFSRIGKKKVMVHAKEWQGTPLDPLSPRKVIAEIAEDLKRYELTWAYTDQWSAEANDDIAAMYGISLVAIDWTQAEKVESFLSLLVAMQENSVELLGFTNIERDLKNTRRNPRPGGGVSIQFLKTKDGRHCDFAPPIARCLKQWIAEEGHDPPEPGTSDFHKQQEEAMIRKEVEVLNRSGLDESFQMRLRL